MEVIDSNKHSSLLRYGINNDLKNFIVGKVGAYLTGLHSMANLLALPSNIRLGKMTDNEKHFDLL